jgi:hypothetical protein
VLAPLTGLRGAGVDRDDLSNWFLVLRDLERSSPSCDIERVAAGRASTQQEVDGRAADGEVLVVSPPAAPAIDVFALVLAEIERADDEESRGRPARPRSLAAAGRDAHRVPFLELDASRCGLGGDAGPGGDLVEDCPRR